MKWWICATYTHMCLWSAEYGIDNYVMECLRASDAICGGVSRFYSMFISHGMGACSSAPSAPNQRRALRLFGSLFGSSALDAIASAW